MANKKIKKEGSEDIFNFRVGSFECTAIRDTIFDEGPDTLFPHIPPEEIKQLCDRFDIKLMDQFEMTCLIVDTGKNLVLTDTGWGLGWTPGSGKLIEKLDTIGLSCSDIDIVIHTHAHPDHIGGNTFADSRPVFPNARYVICKNEWDYWTSGPDLGKLNNEIKQTILEFFEKKLLNIRDHLDIVDDDTEIIPGIRCLRTPGHTPGHTAFVFSSGDYQIISCGDVAHQPFQLLKPEWSMSGDFDFEQAKNSRIGIFDHASRSNTILFACHFPFPGVGTVEKHGDAWIWNSYKV